MNNLLKYPTLALDVFLGTLIFLVCLVVGYFVIIISTAGIGLWYTQMSAVSIYNAFIERGK